MNGRKVQRYAVWGLLWAAFLMFGLWMRGQVLSHGVSEVMGYDYATFMAQFRDPAWITYTGVRHPGLGFLTAPVVLLEYVLNAAFGGTAADVLLLAFFAAVATANAWLVHRIGGIVAAVAFLSFSFTWLLASVPESFPLAMLTLLAVVLAAQRSPDKPRLHTAVWIVMFLLCSAVTVTNGLKVAVAYLIVNRPPRRRILLLCAVAAGVAALGAGFFALRMARWNMQHPEARKTICGAIAQTASWIPAGLGFAGRLKLGLVNFFAIPVQPWKGLGVDSALGLLLPLTVGWLGWCWAVLVYLAAIAGAWFNRHERVVQVMLGMFTVDVAIHLACGWGVAEGWLFCAHWFYMLPICIGLGVSRVLRRWNLAKYRGVVR